MPILRLPKTIQWLLSCALIILISLSIYRLGLYILYKGEFNEAKQNLAAALWTGFRFDARLVGGLTFVLVFMSFFPGMHLFKTSLGKNTALVLYTSFIAGLLVFYLADFVYIYSFKTRLNGNLISELAKNTEKGKVFRHNTPWIALFVLEAVVTWLFFLLIRWLHTLISKKASGSDDKLVRTYWQVLTVVLCLLSIQGRIGKWPLNEKIAASYLPPAAMQLSLNPVESFFRSLPKSKTQSSLLPADKNS